MRIMKHVEEDLKALRDFSSKHFDFKKSDKTEETKATETEDTEVEETESTGNPKMKLKVPEENK